MGEEPNMTTFAIDYHGTFSSDPELFRLLVARIQQAGHTCVLVTGIGDGDRYAVEVRSEVRGLMPIVFANGAWKEEAAKLAGFAVDIWIDDHPEGIRRQTPEFIRSRGDYTKELLEKK